MKFLATVLAAATVVCCADERVSFEETDHEEMMNAPSDAGPRAMPDARYSIGGVVDGLVGSVVLGLNSPGRDTEELTLERNGNFSFRHTLATDDEYEVVVLTQPQDEFCLVEDGAGIVDDEDVVEVFVVCDPGNPGLDNIELSVGSLDPVFSPQITRYRVDVPLWIERLDITPDATDSDVKVSVASERFREQPIPVDLNLGRNTVELSTIADNGDSRTYTLDIYRANRVVEEAYGKATVPVASAQLGYVMSLSDNLLAVGAPNHNSGSSGINGNENDESLLSAGAVYIFERTTTGWRQDAFIKPEHPGENDLFGLSVSLVDDMLVVGAPQESSDSPGVDGNANSDELPIAGAAYVFQRRDRQWKQTAYLKSDVPYEGESFGNAVILQPDGERAKERLVVGAYRDKSSAVGVNPSARDQGAINSGAVYVFERRAGGWAQTAYIKASNTDPGDAFGETLALSGDTLVVGATREQSNAQGIDSDQQSNDVLFAGAGYVFEYDAADDAWTQVAYLKAHNGKERIRFGNALSIDGSTLAVGAFTEPSGATGIDGDGDDTSQDEAGAVYIFDRIDGEWEQTAYIKASNSDAGDRFGSALVLRGNALAVGATLEASAQAGVPHIDVEVAQGDNGAPYAGAVYVFFRRDGEWTQHAYLKASNAQPGDNFGHAIGFDGVTLAVGAPYEDSAFGGIAKEGGPNNVSISSGAIYWFR